jgi:hypothetical protein
MKLDVPGYADGGPAQRKKGPSVDLIALFATE